MVETINRSDVRTLTIDSVHSVAEFSVRHMMVSTVKGKFHDVQGTITFDENEFEHSEVAVTIAAESISTGEPNRDAHLRSDDFFETDKFPELTFQSTKVTPKSGDDFTIDGVLTMRGVSKPVTIDAEKTGDIATPEGKRIFGFTGTTKIRRKDYGLNWNVALEAGGVTVSDEVKITLEIQGHEA